MRVPEWLSAEHTLFMYQRNFSHAPCYCPNRGFEAGVYFTFIAQHYSNLPAFTVFVQVRACPAANHSRLETLPSMNKTLDQCYDVRAYVTYAHAGRLVRHRQGRRPEGEALPRLDAPLP